MSEAEKLRAELAGLRRRLDRLEAPAHPTAAPAPLGGLAFPGQAVVFPARDQTADEGGAWQEMAASGTSLADLIEGRIGDTGDEPIRLGVGEYVLLATPDAGGARVRYVRLDLLDGFDVRITGATQDGTNKRWKYTAVEVEKATAGYGGWATKTGGREATGDAGGGNHVYVFNRIEDQNAATGTYGPGYSSLNIAAAGGTFALQPLATGTRVRVREVLAATGETEWWTQVANVVDGACA